VYRTHPTRDHARGMADTFTITVRGGLPAGFGHAFPDTSVTTTQDTSQIHGRLVDPAHLDGVLAHLRALGVPLLAVTTSPAQRPEELDQ